LTTNRPMAIGRQPSPANGRGSGVARSYAGFGSATSRSSVAPEDPCPTCARSSCNSSRLLPPEARLRRRDCSEGRAAQGGPQRPRLQRARKVRLAGAIANERTLTRRGGLHRPQDHSVDEAVAITAPATSAGILDESGGTSWCPGTRGISGEGSVGHSSSTFLFLVRNGQHGHCEWPDTVRAAQQRRSAFGELVASATARPGDEPDSL